MSLGKFSKISCPILILVFMSYCSVVIKWHITDQALGARAGALLQARVRGQSRRAVLRQATDPLRGKPGGISSQRLAAVCRADFHHNRSLEADTPNILLFVHSKTLTRLAEQPFVSGLLLFLKEN